VKCSVVIVVPDFSRNPSRLAISTVAFGPDCRTVASSRNDGTLRLWDVTSRKEIGRTRFPNPSTDGVKTVAYSPDGAHLYATHTDDTLRTGNRG
jgi:WD40 repeat protein